MSETLTETGNARRLVHHYGERIRYCHGLGWLAWDGRHWQPDATAELSRLAQRTVELIETLELPEVTDAKERARLVQHIQRSRSARAYRGMLEIAASDLRMLATPETLDADPSLLNLTNGTLNVATGQLGPHDPADLITKLAAVTYDPAARCPEWLAFLEMILPDAGARAFFQPAAGSTLTAERVEQLLVVMFGTGANGKTTTLEVLAAILGDYAVQLPEQMLLTGRRSSSGADPELLMLRGARFIAGVESGEGRELNEVLVKRLLGGDTLSARGLYSNVYVTVAPRGHIFYCTNHKPNVTGMDVGMWRRVAVVPFEVEIPEADRDPEWAARVLEAERSGILNWLLAGYAQWRDGGAAPPAAVAAAAAEYRADMDALGAFLAERCTLDAAATTALTDVVAAFNTWAKEMHVPLTSPRMLGPELRGRPERLVVEKKRHGRVVEGLRLNTGTLAV